MNIKEVNKHPIVPSETDAINFGSIYNFLNRINRIYDFLKDYWNNIGSRDWMTHWNGDTRVINNYLLPEIKVIAANHSLNPYTYLQNGESEEAFLNRIENLLNNSRNFVHDVNKAQNKAASIITEAIKLPSYFIPGIGNVVLTADVLGYLINGNYKEALESLVFIGGLKAGRAMIPALLKFAKSQEFEKIIKDFNENVDPYKENIAEVSDKNTLYLIPKKPEYVKTVLTTDEWEYPKETILEYYKRTTDPKNLLNRTRINQTSIRAGVNEFGLITLNGHILTKKDLDYLGEVGVKRILEDLGDTANKKGEVITGRGEREAKRFGMDLVFRTYDSQTAKDYMFGRNRPFFTTPYENNPGGTSAAKLNGLDYRRSHIKYPKNGAIRKVKPQLRNASEATGFLEYNTPTSEQLLWKNPESGTEIEELTTNVETTPNVKTSKNNKVEIEFDGTTYQFTKLQLRNNGIILWRGKFYKGTFDLTEKKEALETLKRLKSTPKSNNFEDLLLDVLEFRKAHQIESNPGKFIPDKSSPLTDKEVLTIMFSKLLRNIEKIVNRRNKWYGTNTPAPDYSEYFNDLLSNLDSKKLGGKINGGSLTNFLKEEGIL